MRVKPWRTKSSYLILEGSSAGLLTEGTREIHTKRDLSAYISESLRSIAAWVCTGLYIEITHALAASLSINMKVRDNPRLSCRTSTAHTAASSSRAEITLTVLCCSLSKTFLGTTTAKNFFSMHAPARSLNMNMPILPTLSLSSNAASVKMSTFSSDTLLEATWGVQCTQISLPIPTLLG